MTNSVFTYTGINTIKLNGAEGNSGNAYVDVEGLFQTPAAFEQTTASPSTGQGQVWLYGGGTLRLTAAVPELNPLGANPAAVKFVTYTNCGTIDTAGYDTVINNDITGAGGLTKAGAGALTLASDTPISYTNDTRITGGTLVLSNSATLSSTNILIGGGAVLDVTPLATQPYALSSYQVVGNLSSTATLNGSVDAATAPAAINLSYAAGTPALTVRNGSLTLAAATPVTVNNTGAALGNGSYKLISAGTAGSVAGSVPLAAVVTGNGMGSGGTASLSLTAAELYLNVTGAVTVNTTPTNITVGVSSGNLNLSWPADHTGWRLLAQTNHLAAGISLNTNDWGTVAGSASTNQVSIPIDTAKRTEFYRLVYP
jgi:autotransporter-associated beta strand protein